MKKLAFALLASSLALASLRAGDPQAKARADKGAVLATNRLDVDFAPYKVTFLELGADRCIPCRKMQPIMKEVAAEFPEDLQVVFYDVWKDPNPGRKYGIQLIPTQVFLDAAGKEIGRHVGLYPKEELVGWLALHGVKK